MPICMKVPDLAPGMTLYQAICNDYIVLLPPGKVLDQRDIDALRLRYPDKQVMVCDPLLDDVYDFQDNNKDNETSQHVQESMTKALTGVRQRLMGRTTVRSQDILSLQRAALDIMRYLKDNPVTAILLDKTQDAEAYIQEHSANVFYISMIVGNAVKQYIVEERERLSNSNRLERSYALNLTPLAMGCLLHDIGMLPLKDIYTAVGELTDEQRRRLQSHPLDGEKMLPVSLSPVARMVVRTHHENFNGSGYPKQIAGEKLHVFSRIIRIADAFDAATSPRIYKKAKSEVRLMWEMTNGPMREHYDQVITKVFVGMLNPFPIGAKLKLSNGTMGVVVRQNVRSPFHPYVIIAYDRNGARIDREELRPPINLLKHPDLRILSFNGEDLSYLHTTSAVQSEDRRDIKSPQDTFSYAYP